MILKLGELTHESLGCEPDESMVVNFAFKLYRMADESVSIGQAARRVAKAREGARATRDDFGRAGNEHKFYVVYGVGDGDLPALRCPV